MRKDGNNMKCAFISVLMNLIYGEGPGHNFFPSKSMFKSLIHLCSPAVITTALFILKYWTHSDVVISLFYQWLSCCETLFGNLAQMIQPLNQENIFAIKKYMTSTCFTDNPRLVCYHWNTWFQWLMLDSSGLPMALPAFLLLRRSRGGAGSPASWVGIWIGLSLLEQSRALRSLPALIWLSYKHAIWKNSGLNDWGYFALWHFLLWWWGWWWHSDTEVAVTTLSFGNGETEGVTWAAEHLVPTEWLSGILHLLKCK